MALIYIKKKAYGLAIKLMGPRPESSVSRTTITYRPIAKFCSSPVYRYAHKKKKKKPIVCESLVSGSWVLGGGRRAELPTTKANLRVFLLLVEVLTQPIAPDKKI